MFDEQDIWNEISRRANIQLLFQDLKEKFIELDRPHRTNNIINGFREDFNAYLSAKLRSLNDETEQILKEHRVLKVRSELEDWWTKCRFSENQRLAFEPYSSRNFTDELLVSHEQELQSLKRYHADNLALFEMIDHYLELFDRSLKLEAHEKDPNRLFENRGGQLLKDERDRKAARRDLPKLEKKISLLTAEFERRNARPFTINGVGFQESLQMHVQKFKEQAEAFRVANSTSDGSVARMGSGLKRKNAALGSASKQPKLQATARVRKALHPNNNN